MENIAGTTHLNQAVFISAMASESEGGPEEPLPPPGVSSRPLRAVMEGLFQEQKYDILLRTKGYLNHNRLWKPPEMASHKPWESSGKEVPLLLAPSKLPSPRRAQVKEDV